MRTEEGKRRHALAVIRNAMVSRCHDPRDLAFARYGGRGITVCQRWRESLDAFIEDMGPRPAGYQLDRKENDGNYEPGNVRWATRKQNQRNRRNSTMVEHRGRTQHLYDWADELGINPRTLYKRIAVLGWSPERALTTGSARAPEAV